MPDDSAPKTPWPGASLKGARLLSFARSASGNRNRAHAPDEPSAPSRSDVVEQRVVDSEPVHRRARDGHVCAGLRVGLCQPPSMAINASAWSGPQLPGR